MATKQLPGLTTLLPADSIDSSADLMLVRDTSTGADVKVLVGTVVGRDHGTAAGQVPLNSDIYKRIGSTGPASCRNKIRNPRFQVNQRAVSGTVTLAAGAFGHDGWKGGSAGCTYTFSTTQGRTTITITAGSLVQTVDGVDLAAGANMHTLSWGGTCQGKIGAGSYGASGVTGSATGGTNINVEFGPGTLYAPQFEIGTVASEFDSLPLEQEYRRCYRYLQKSFAPLIAPQNGVDATTFYNEESTTAVIGYQGGGCNIPFPVLMRSAPTVTIYGNSNGQVRTATTGNAPTWVSSTGIDKSASERGLSICDSTRVFTWVQLHWTASAEI